MGDSSPVASKAKEAEPPNDSSESQPNSSIASKTSRVRQPATDHNKPTNARQDHVPFNQAADLSGSKLPLSSPKGVYSMTPIANSLPPLHHRPAQYGGHPRHDTSNATFAMSQMPPLSPYGPSSPMSGSGHAFYSQRPYSMPQHPGPGQFHASHDPGTTSRFGVPYYTDPMVMGQGYYYPNTAPYGLVQPGYPPNMAAQAHYVPSSSQGILDLRPPVALTGFPIQAVPDDNAKSPSAVRIPPRKPKQSGHAIWIGNLPPQTDLMGLVSHVCHAAPGLESLFLISKSNCAFANFKDEKSCVDAQQNIHDSQFHTVRLVSRLRKSAVEGSGGVRAPTGPSEASISSPVVDSIGSKSHGGVDGLTTPVQHTQLVATTEGIAESINGDRFFVLKSLTLEDLHLSVQTGIWATQSHNEVSLNKAFEKADNVYLVFSANKSGEYFGYARMASEINQNPEAAIEFAPQTPVTNDVNAPKAIVTDSTETVPRGRIIDDSARGTIFWEVDKEGLDSGSDEESEVSTNRGNNEDGMSAKKWGKPFRLEWLSTHKLPFHRTRGLRNPWNSNREVKIARDGTELEPSVGRRLIGLFNRVQSPAQYGPHIQAPVTLTPGFSHSQMP